MFGYGVSAESGDDTCIEARIKTSISSSSAVSPKTRDGPRPDGDKNMRRSLPAVAIFVATLFPGKSATQIPDEFTNLQVLHDTLSRQTLIRTMKGFTRALGVRCEFRHVGDPARGLSSFDFASDENKHKDIARTMLRMVRNINEEQLTALPFRAGIKVECMTCHRGNKEPRFIEDVLD